MCPPNMPISTRKSQLSLCEYFHRVLDVFLLRICNPHWVLSIASCRPPRNIKWKLRQPYCLMICILPSRPS